MKIILDGMGGDHAPQAVADGMAQAMRRFPDLDFVLTGDPGRLKLAIQEAGADAARVEIVPAAQAILMGDSPVRAIREKTDSTMVRALELLAENPDAMLISAGNTGALVAGATMIVRRIKGVKRPALAPVLPTRTGAVLLIDGGANAECKASYLAQFGVMGSIYMNKVLGVQEPRVVLINNGSEAGKGTPLTKEAYKLLSKAPIRFVGNVEGRDLLSGEYDVLVTDGFTGNVVLKFVEGCSRTILGMLKEYIQESFTAKLGASLMKNVFRRLRTKMDYREYGGALLLGVNGGVMKAHGSSDAQAFYAAIRAARSFILGGVVQEIRAEIAAMEKAAARTAEKSDAKTEPEGRPSRSRKGAGKGSARDSSSPKQVRRDDEAAGAKENVTAKKEEEPASD